MHILQQITLLCRPGFESECATELMDYASGAGYSTYINAKTSSGFAHLVSAEGDDMTSLLNEIDFDELIFARQWFASTQKINNLPEQNRTAPLVSIARQITDQLECKFNGIELSYADTNKGKALNHFCKAFGPHMLDALKQQKLLSSNTGFRLHILFLDSSSAWMGISPLDNSAHDPMGIPRLRMPKSAPSRSTLKLDEAINWFLTTEQQESLFKPGMHAVDLGAAPRGWSRQLVNRGLLETAIDNGPMDKA